MEGVLRKLEGRCDFADVGRSRVRSSFVEAKDRQVLTLGTLESEGYGVRVLVDGCWGFASVNTEDRLAAAAERALRLAKASARFNTVTVSMDELPARKVRYSAPWVEDVRDVSLEEKKDLVSRMEKACYIDDAIRTTSSLYKDTHVDRTYIDTAGSDVETAVQRVFFRSVVKGRRGDLIQETTDGHADVGGFEVARRGGGEALAVDAAERVLRLLDAKPAPGGTFPVVMNPELVGVFVHEAVGHACEADHILAGTSAFAGREGTAVGSDMVTIADDPTLPGYGHYAYDSEGVAGVRTVLIEGGTLIGFMNSRESASRLGVAPNGHGRSGSYAQPPIVRMSNTHMTGGDHDLEELFEGIKRGVYMRGEYGGVVNTTSGEFLFKSKEGRLIENGEVGEPLRDAAMTGQVRETLLHVSRVGKDMRLVHKPGACGKQGQHVPVDLGGPHIRVEEVRVGGSV